MTPTRYLHFYHNGVTEDLSCVINHALNRALSGNLSDGIQPGGHVGFVAFNKTGEYYSEKRAMRF